MVCVSCVKQGPQLEGDNIEGSIPSAGNFEYITAVSPGTPVRTIISNGTKVLWTDEDKIGMYSADGSSSTVQYEAFLNEPSAEAKFGRVSDNVPTKVNGRYYAVYPSSSIAKWALNTEQKTSDTVFCSVNVPKLQTAVKDSWDKKSAILVASSDTNNFVFKHAVAYLRIEVTEQTGAFVSVRLSSNNKEKLSDTQASVRFVSTNEVEVIPGPSASDFVTLKNAEGNGVFVSGAYYIALLPGDFAQGLTLSFTDAEGLTAEHIVKPLNLNPGEVADCGPVPALTFVENNTSLELAKVYKENDIKQGVVYWVDPDNPTKGKIFSASSGIMDWSENLSQSYLWTEKIQSQDDGLLNYNQFNASEVYTSQKDKFYALKYCEDLRNTHGGNWYLPAPKELRTIYQAYYGLSALPETNAVDYRLDNLSLSMSAKAEFDNALSMLGETTYATLDGDADADGISDNNGYGDNNGVTYWTSKVNTGGPVQYLTIGVYEVNNTGKVFKQAYVRCVRDVSLSTDEDTDDNEDPDTGDENDPGTGDNEPGTGDDNNDPGTGDDNPGSGDTGDNDNPGSGDSGDNNEPGTDEPGDDNEPGTDEPGDDNEPGTDKPGDDNEPGTEDPGDNDDPGTGDDTGSSIAPLDPFDIFNPNKKTKRVSLLGDSITSFKGTLPAYFEENDAAYYPTGNVTSVTQQYWHKLIYNKMSNAVLDVNNSWRGSTVVWREHPDYDGKDYCARVERYGLGNPDVILIHGGTNDCTKYSASHQTLANKYRANLYPGEAYEGMAPASIPSDAEFEAVYDLAEAADTWEEIVALDDEYFIHAYVKLLNMIHFKHPNAKVVIIIGDWLTKRAQQSLTKIAEHYGQLYGYKYVAFEPDFNNVGPISKVSSAHPDDAGFSYMADTIYEKVGSYIDK